MEVDECHSAWIDAAGQRLIRGDLTPTPERAGRAPMLLMDVAHYRLARLAHIARLACHGLAERLTEARQPSQVWKCLSQLEPPR
jgi:hypothetical protein